MKILISTLTTFGAIFIFIAIVFLIMSLIKKMTYYPSNRQDEISDKISDFMYKSGFFFFCGFVCFALAKEIIKKDFKTSIKENKIVSARVNDVFFSNEDMEGIFTKFQSTEGRYMCESYMGFLDLENGETLPIKIIKHCYEKNRFIIVSKKYSIDATIGDIITDKFDSAIYDSIK
jgi:hypothetical protein